MTVAITGKSTILTTSTGATEVRTLTCDELTDIHDITSYDSSGHHEYIEGLDGVVFSGTGVGVKPTRGADAALSIATGSNTWSGAAKLNSVSIGIPVDGEVTYDFAGVFTGAVTIT